MIIKRTPESRPPRSPTNASTSAAASSCGWPAWPRCRWPRGRVLDPRLRCASSAAERPQTPLSGIKPNVVTTDEKLNTFEEITSYNNFYEFGTGKDDPARYAGRLKTSPWKVKIDGLCGKPADYQLEDLIKPHRARGADLPPALRRSLVDGDPVGRDSARERPQARRADGEGHLRRVHDAAAARPRCRGSVQPAARVALHRRAAAWTRRCTR